MANWIQCDFRHMRHSQMGQSMFLQLLEAFKASIVTTYNCKFTQFLVFFCCSFNEEHSRIFIQLLGGALCNLSLSSIERQACAAYLSSFVCRASFVTDDMVLEVLGVLVDQAESYVLQHIGTNTGSDTETHGLLYGLSQAVCLLVCFRKDLLITAGYMSIIQRDKFSRVMSSQFKPLYSCQVDVVNEFIEIWPTNLSKLQSEYPIGATKSVRRHRQLEHFFPFDPYQLFKSADFIDPIYTTWNQRDSRHRAASDFSTTDCPSDEEDTEDTPVVGALAQSFNSMSFSPSNMEEFIKQRLENVGDSSEMGLNGFSPMSFGI